MDTLEVLIKARAEVQKGWDRCWAVSPEGNVCALGAIGLAVGELSRSTALPIYLCDSHAAKVLRDHTPEDSVVKVNDYGTKADVLALFDRAINSLVPVGDTSHVHRVA